MQHNTYFIIRIDIYMLMLKYVMHLNTEIIVETTCSQGRPPKNLAVHFISESLYVDIMSLICFR